MDPAPIDALLRQQESRLRALLRKHVRSLDDDELDDLMQEVRVRLWKSLEREKTIEHLPSYVQKVVLSVVIDAQRRRVVRQEESLSEPLAAVLVDERGSAETDAQGSERIAQLRAALARLPERRRQPAQLLLMGHAVPEIARIMQMTDGTARNLAYRGVDELRALLRDTEDRS
ncbi:MAG: sigma-70 family RNA polymerase sigma factor [Lysobacteraceae bacterium]